MAATPPHLEVELVENFKAGDLQSLCDVTTEAIEAGGGFGWVSVPERDVLERYWRGTLVVPERLLFLAKLDGAVAGTAQLMLAPRNNEAQAFAAQVSTAFVAPWARGYGLARKLFDRVEDEARSRGIALLNLDVRETQTAAIALYRALGYTEWGSHPYYAQIGGRMLRGLFFYKQLGEADPADTGVAA